MPLTQNEIERLGNFLRDNGMVNDQPGGASENLETLLSAITQQIAVVTRLCEMVEVMADHAMTAMAPEIEKAVKDAKTTETKKAPAKKAPGKKRGRPPKAEREAKAEREDEAGANGAAEDNPFNEPSAKAAGAAEDMFGEAPDTTEGEQPNLTQDELKDVLRSYMAKHGENGTAKLTELLEEFGVKRFNELQPEQFDAVAEKARAEMAA